MQLVINPGENMTLMCRLTPRGNDKSKHNFKLIMNQPGQYNQELVTL